jgi:putative transposase
VDTVLRDICLDIENRYQVKILEIGTDKDHIHFLIQSLPTYSVAKIVTMIKSITARVFKRCPQVKKQLWGGELWTDGYYVATVGKHGNGGVIGTYVKSQGSEYRQLHENRQLMLF